jgi:hypothetical protein
VCGSAEAAVQAAFDSGDWETLRLLLHPYLHWTEGDETVRGRTKVLARLRASNRLPRPSSVELRVGQVYRWVA